MNDIYLTDVTMENWEDLVCMNPGKEGREYVASNGYSIVQALYEKHWIVKAIMHQNELIGCTMYGFSEELQAFELCRFMIAEKYQGKGYGQSALKVILTAMKETFGCHKIYLSTDPRNMRGKHVYTKEGFAATGETCGEEDELEEIFCLEL